MGKIIVMIVHNLLCASVPNAVVRICINVVVVVPPFCCCGRGEDILLFDAAYFWFSIAADSSATDATCRCS